MTTRTYFRWSLLLPLVVPLILLPVAFHPAAGQLPPVVQELGMVIVASIVVGGIPYLGLAAYFLKQLQTADLRTIRLMSLAAPLAFLLPAVAFWLLFSGHVEPARLALFALPVGYFYVALAHAGYFMMRGLGYVEEEAAGPTALSSGQSPSRDTSG